MSKFYIPGSIGNVGPGFDVLGLAVEGIGNTYEMKLAAKSSIRSVTGIDASQVPRNPEKNLSLVAAHRMAQRLGYSDVFFELAQHQELPIGGGP